MPHESSGMVKVVGSSGQISLGKRYAGQYYELEHLPGGAIVLHPVKIVPAAEPVEPESKGQVQLKKVK